MIMKADMLRVGPAGAEVAVAGPAMERVAARRAGRAGWCLPRAGLIL
jgi:hypothetical protein